MKGRELWLLVTFLAMVGVTACSTGPSNPSQTQRLSHAQACTSDLIPQHMSTAVQHVGTCLRAVLNDKEQDCAQDRAVELSALPVPQVAAAVTIPDLVIQAAHDESLVRVGLPNELERIAPSALVIRRNTTLTVSVLDSPVGDLHANWPGQNVVTSNWTALSSRLDLPDSQSPGRGEFVLTKWLAEELQLQQGQVYWLRSGSNHQTFAYAGAIDPPGPSLWMGLHDADALRFLADGRGYDNLNVYVDDGATLVAVEQAIDASENLKVSRAASRFVELVSESSAATRDALAVLMCVAPEIRVVAVQEITRTEIDQRTTDCVLVKLAADPRDTSVMPIETDC